MNNRFDNLTGHRYAPGFGRLDEAEVTPWHEPFLRYFETLLDPMTLGTLSLALACGLLVHYGNHRRRTRRRAERLAAILAKAEARAAQPARPGSGFEERLARLSERVPRPRRKAAP